MPHKLRIRMRFIGYTLFVLVLLGGAVALYAASTRDSVPLVFSPWQMLGTLWLNYKSTYVSSDFRTIDPGRSNDTTSEGQSYTMLRAVWMSDKETFDGAWGWTTQHLERPDHLFSWLWGARPDGSTGILTAQSGQNSASDADTDIALALLMAYARWQDPQYLASAHAIIDSIWNNEVVMVGGKPYLAADNIEKKSKSPVIVINPSYFNPAAYRLFAQADPAHPWLELEDDSYQLLQQAMEAPLDTGNSAGLPPDWVLMNRSTGTLSAPQGSSQTTNFSYDALRVPWRLALDYQWSGDERDLKALERLSFLTRAWQRDHMLASAYHHDGAVAASTQTPAMYGGTIGYFLFADPADSQAVYRKELLALFDPDKNGWKTTLSYYDDNWAWFGIALYNNLLPNLAATIPLR